MQQEQVPIQWQCDLKFGRNENTKYPTFKLKYEPPVDLKNDAEIDKSLIEQAVDIPLSYYYDKIR